MPTYMSLTRRPTSQHRKWMLGALATLLWMSPGAAQTASPHGNVSEVDDAGRWPFSSRSMSDRDTHWRTTYTAPENGDKPDRDRPASELKRPSNTVAIDSAGRWPFSGRSMSDRVGAETR